jgi:hypothetical protein
MRQPSVKCRQLRHWRGNARPNTRAGDDALCNAALGLGPVDIHLSHIMALTKNSIDTYDSAVFS